MVTSACSASKQKRDNREDAKHGQRAKRPLGELPFCGDSPQRSTRSAPFRPWAGGVWQRRERSTCGRVAARSNSSNPQSPHDGSEAGSFSAMCRSLRPASEKYRPRGRIGRERCCPRSEVSWLCQARGCPFKGRRRWGRARGRCRPPPGRWFGPRSTCVESMMSSGGDRLACELDPPRSYSYRTNTKHTSVSKSCKTL
jgi:hypothetical protein